MTPRDLWHYTCEHGHRELLARRLCLPARLLTERSVPWTGRLVWLTDLDAPIRDALGLTMRLVSCDRTQYRYRVTDDSEVRPWVKIRRTAPREIRDELEGAEGAMPAHWYVSEVGVPVVFDPIVPRSRSTNVVLGDKSVGGYIR